MTVLFDQSLVLKIVENDIHRFSSQPHEIGKIALTELERNHRPPVVINAMLLGKVDEDAGDASGGALVGELLNAASELFDASAHHGEDSKTHVGRLPRKAQDHVATQCADERVLVRFGHVIARAIVEKCQLAEDVARMPERLQDFAIRWPDSGDLDHPPLHKEEMFTRVPGLVNPLAALDLLHPGCLFQQSSLGFFQGVNELEPLEIPELGVHRHAADCNNRQWDGGWDHRIV